MNFPVFMKQMEEIVREWEALVESSEHSDFSDIAEPKLQALVSRSVSAVKLTTGPASAHSQELDRVLKVQPYLVHHGPLVAGIASAVFHDLKCGYLASVVELVHADLFSDFLEMAEHLLQSDYKDAAAVIAGSSLEAHLRALAQKHGVSTDQVKPDGTTNPKAGNQLNNELASVQAYHKNDQKSITGWLGLRNSSAHGKYGDYTKEQVVLMVAGIRDFIGRSPA